MRKSMAQPARATAASWLLPGRFRTRLRSLPVCGIHRCQQGIEAHLPHGRCRAQLRLFVVQLFPALLLIVCPQMGHRPRRRGQDDSRIGGQGGNFGVHFGHHGNQQENIRRASHPGSGKERGAGSKTPVDADAFVRARSAGTGPTALPEFSNDHAKYFLVATCCFLLVVFPRSRSPSARAGPTPGHRIAPWRPPRIIAPAPAPYAR
jgi:hypothetical protein